VLDPPLAICTKFLLLQFVDACFQFYKKFKTQECYTEQILTLSASCSRWLVLICCKKKNTFGWPVLVAVADLV